MSCWASVWASHHVVRLAPKSQLDLKDDDGLTPLESAKSAGSTAIVEILTAAMQA